MRSLSISIVLAFGTAGCNGSALSPTDGGGSNTDGTIGTPLTDMAVPVGPDPVAVAACENQLMDWWKKRQSSTGIASPSSAAAYDAVMYKLLGDFDIPGGAVSVVKDGKLVFAKGYGLSDRDAPQLTSPDDRYRIASLSKQITAAAILKLVEAGKLNLDDKAFPIVADLQPLPGKTTNPALASVTVRHLLNHTGGWNRDKTGDPMLMSPAISAALNQPGPADCPMTIRYMLDKAPTYPAGATTCYSNFGYCVLGRIIERKSGMDYQTAVQTLVLKPLGANRTILGHTLFPLRADDEVIYFTDPGLPLVGSVFPNVMGKVERQYGGWNLEAMDSHGGWITSVIDHARLEVGMDGRKSPPDILSPASLVEMVKNPVVTSCNADGSTSPANPNYWYGFGLSVNSSDNWWHTGLLDGTQTEVVRAHGSYGWSVFFNGSANDRNGFAGRVDGDMWTALTNTQSFLPGDLFDQFATPSDWLPDADFLTRLGAEQAAGHWAPRIEGRQGQNGHFEFRAEFVPLHAGTLTTLGVGLDCFGYEGLLSIYGTQGYDPVNVQWFVDSKGQRRFQASFAKF